MTKRVSSLVAKKFHAVGQVRPIIVDVKPQVDQGQFPAKRVSGDKVLVDAIVICDGHEVLTTILQWKKSGERRWNEVPMKFIENDHWQATFEVSDLKEYIFTVQSW